MALDLSIKSHKRSSAAVTDAVPAGQLLGDVAARHGRSKRVSFAAGECGGVGWRWYHHPYPRAVSHDHAGHGSDENRPPYNSHSPTLPPSSKNNRLLDWSEAIHPASRPSHMTLPVRMESDIIAINNLPSDPREWSRRDVSSWLVYMKRTHKLEGVMPDRFPMNGKALCLMNANMFSYRVPNGGKLLYRDFKMRLACALGRQQLISSAFIAPPLQA